MKRSQVEVTKILPDWTEEEREDQQRKVNCLAVFSEGTQNGIHVKMKYASITVTTELEACMFTSGRMKVRFANTSLVQ